MLFSPAMETPRQPAPQVEGANPAPDEGELRLGSTPRGAAANGVILALMRAARSFLLYDPSNEAIRHFLQALRTSVDECLATYGDLPLTVRPFELVVEGEVVYLDRDRERSLAFRLYRDGVRRVTLGVGLTWHELLKLLEVLSIRYTGVRQTEDDMVVLLWKAGFTNIQLEAVEGFVPEEEVGEEAAYTGGGGHGGVHVEIPLDFDLPATSLTARGALQRRPLSEPDLERLRSEDSTQALPELCIRLCRRLLAAAMDRTDPLGFGEIISQLREIRDFLLSEGLLTTVLAMARLLAEARFVHPRDTLDMNTLLASFGDERAVGRLLKSMPRDATSAPPEMIEFLDLLPGNHLKMVVSMLDTERGEASRRVARSLIERYVSKNIDWILDQLGVTDSSVAIELLRAFAAADPLRAIEGVQAVGGRGEIDVQLEALHVLERVAPGPAAGKLLLAFMQAPTEEVRIRALDLLGRQAARPAFAPIAEQVKGGAAARVSLREADACGVALARTDPERAMALFREWLKPKGIFGSVMPGQSTLQWAGVSGLVWIPGDDAEALIKASAERGGSELAAHCTQCMVKRRRLARGAT